MIAVCVLLGSPIKNDSRVIKIVNSLSKFAFVDLYYIDGHISDAKLFRNNIRLFSFRKRNHFLLRIRNHFLFYKEFIFFANKVVSSKIKYDYVYANDLPCLLPAFKIKKKLGAKLIYDAHEIYCETINQFFPNAAKFPRNLLFLFLIKVMRFVGEIIEKKYSKEVDFFITVGNSLKNYFEEKYSLNNIFVMMNCPQKIIKNNAINYLNVLNLKKESKVFIYQGVLNYGRGLLIMIDAFKFVNTDAVLLILGDGIMKNDLIKRVMDLEVDKKVFFLPRITYEELPTYTKGAFCGINLLEYVNLSKYLAAPNKLFEYIQAGIPVIASYSPENDAVFSKFQIGIQVENTPQSVAMAIDKMYKTDTNIFSTDLLSAANEYCWENQEMLLNRIIR